MSAANRLMSEILDDAKAIVTGDRQRDYGSPEDNHSRTAEVWQWYLKHIGPRALSAADVCALNRLQKESRNINRPVRDNLLDIIGFAANAEACQGAIGNEQMATYPELAEPRLHPHTRFARCTTDGQG